MVPLATPDKGELDPRRSAALYWAGALLVVSGLFVTRLLPCVDYPQHLALSDIARRLFRPGAPEHLEYELNLFTYNGLFHLLAAVLSQAMPIELAGRLLVSGSLLALAAAVLSLVRVLRRPPMYAALFTPILFSFSVGWGFVNYVLATAVAAWALVFVAKAAIRPTSGSLVAVSVLGLACAFAHVLAMLVLCLFAAALAIELGWRVHAGAAPWQRRALFATLRAAIAAGPLLLGCVYCMAVYQRQYDWDPGMYRDPTIEGSAPPIWEKVVFFGAFATDLFGDATDQVVLWVSIGVMGWATYHAWRGAPKGRLFGLFSGNLGEGDKRWGGEHSGAGPPVVLPFAAMTIAYFATPMVLIGTHLIFPRLGQWAIFGAVLATPSFPGAALARGRLYVLRLGILAGANTLLHCALFGWETQDASNVIDDLPPGRAATAVVWDPSTISFRNGTLTHLAAYYAARKHGQWAFAFARYLSVPVRFRARTQPPWPARGWEFSGEDYDPRCAYARVFPLVIVKAPEDLPESARGEPMVRKVVFKEDSEAVRLLSHHGRFWAFDTAGLPSDGQP